MKSCFHEKLKAKGKKGAAEREHNSVLHSQPKFFDRFDVN